jgi:hypothetical protein
VVDIEGNAIKERESHSHAHSLSKLLGLKKRLTHRASSLGSATGQPPEEVVHETGHGRFVIDDMQGGYRFIFFSKKSCLLSAHVKVFGRHISSSPSPFFFAALGPTTKLFGPERGHVLYTSSVHTINGWPDANSAENLRQMSTAAGWLTDGQGTETVVLGFDGVVSLHQIHFLNWAARK